MLKSLYVLCIGLVISVVAEAQNVYEVVRGKVHFSSTAPQELISADSKELKGILDITRKTFAFKLPIATFQGFNSPLQREHFNENYMETERFADATFKGKIIEDVDLSKEGDHKVRAKGKLYIHGLEQERIINVYITTKANKLNFRADLTISLIDHDIKIPRVVYDKLAPDIKVQVSGVLQAK